jgi:hypothetical protein
MFASKCKKDKLLRKHAFMRKAIPKQNIHTKRAQDNSKNISSAYQRGGGAKGAI